MECKSLTASGNNVASGSSRIAPDRGNKHSEPRVGDFFTSIGFFWTLLTTTATAGDIQAHFVRFLSADRAVLALTVRGIPHPSSTGMV